VGRGFIKRRISIDKRPHVVDDKCRIGDWEIDLIIGKGHRGALLTIVERKTSFTITSRIYDKSAKSAKTVKTVKTVTAATIG
jgi:IS30 family transposase